MLKSSACAGAAGAGCASWTNSCFAISTAAGRSPMTAKEAVSYACWIAKTISCGNGAWVANDPTIRSCIPLSSESSSFPIDWRPSRLLASALACLGGLAAAALWLSALPLAVRLSFGLLAVCYGLCLARRELHQEQFSLRISADGSALVMYFEHHSRRLDGIRVLVRGPLASIVGRTEAGQPRRLLWWPDTLAAPSRRALRLAGDQSNPGSEPVHATLSG